MHPQAAVITPGSVTVIEVPVRYANNASATDYGGEAAMTWKPTSRWRVSGAYSYLQPILHQAPSDLNVYNLSADFPRDMASVRSLWNISRRIEFDQSLYYTARLPGSSIPGHARLDMRVARKFGESAEISVVGQNLLQPRALEYGNAYAIIGTEAVRSIYGKIVFRF